MHTLIVVKRKAYVSVVNARSGLYDGTRWHVYRENTFLDSVGERWCWLYYRRDGGGGLGCTLCSAREIHIGWSWSSLTHIKPHLTRYIYSLEIAFCVVTENFVQTMYAPVVVEEDLRWNLVKGNCGVKDGMENVVQYSEISVVILVVRIRRLFVKVKRMGL